MDYTFMFNSGELPIQPEYGLILIKIIQIGAYKLVLIYKVSEHKE